MIWQAFTQQALANPTKTAIVCGEEELTYRHLMQRVYARAEASGRGKVRLENDWDKIDTVIAMLTAAMLKQHLCIYDGNVPKPSFEWCPESAYLIVQSSGSTGAPKPIVLSQATKLRRINYVAKLYGVTSEDVILVSTPLYHSLAQRLVLMALTKGCTLVVLPRWSAAMWYGAVIYDNATFTMTVPAQLNGIIDFVNHQVMPGNYATLSGMRCIVSSSAPMSDEVAEACIKTFPDTVLHECYGTTEVSVVANRHLSLHESGFTLTPEVGATVLDAEQRPAPFGTEGELCFDTPYRADGYIDGPSLKPCSGGDDDFRTGDLGILTADGVCRIQLTGKTGNIINVGGTKVRAEDVEVTYMFFEPRIIDCAAFSMKHENLGEIVALAFVGDFLPSGNLGLPDAAIPRYFFNVDKLPRNEMGKLMRSELPKLAGAI